MTLEEIKDAIVAEVEKLWHGLTGTVDVDRAREVISDSAVTLSSHVGALGQHLFDHVLGNAAQAPAVEAPTNEPPATVSVLVGEPGPELTSFTPAAESVPVDSAPTQELAPVDETAPEASA